MCASIQASVRLLPAQPAVRSLDRFTSQRDALSGHSVAVVTPLLSEDVHLLASPAPSENATVTYMWTYVRHTCSDTHGCGCRSQPWPGTQSTWTCLPLHSAALTSSGKAAAWWLAFPSKTLGTRSTSSPHRQVPPPQPPSSAEQACWCDAVCRVSQLARPRRDWSSSLADLGRARNCSWVQSG